MKGKKLLAGVLSAAMLFSTMAMPAFASSKEVSTSAELKNALLEDSSVTEIVLANDINIVSENDPYNPEVYNIDKKCVIDLKGHTLDLSEIKAFWAKNELTVKNGKIVFSQVNDALFHVGNWEENASGAIVNLTNLTFEQVGNPTNTYFLAFDAVDGVLNIDKCTIDGIKSDYGLISDNSGSTGLTNIKDSVVKSDKRVFQNGSYVVSGTSTVGGTTGGTVEIWAIGDNVEFINTAMAGVAKKPSVISTSTTGIIRAFDNLPKAVEKAGKGDTISVLTDLVGEGITFESGKDLTIDFNGHTYSVVDEKLLAGSSNTKNQVFQCLKGSNITFKNGTLVSPVATRYIQNYANLTLDGMTIDASDNSNVRYPVSFNCGKNVITGNTTIKANPSSKGAFDCYYWAPHYSEGVSVTIDENMTGTIEGNVDVAYSKEGEADADKKLSFVVKGGTFTKPDAIRPYIADGYGLNKNNKVIVSEAKVVDTASSSGVTVQLDDLRLNKDIDHTADATYEVVVSTVEEADKAAIGTIQVADGQSLMAYDIKVVKTENGKSEKVDVENQKVTLTLPTPVTNGSEVKLYHIVNGTAELITPITISEDGTKITFVAPSFSAYVVAYNPAPVNSGDVTSKITVGFEKVATKQNEYDIVLKAEDGKKINGLTTADLTFALTQGTGVVSYEIQPAANINLLNPSENRYEFNFDGINAHEATAGSIVIGKVVFSGYCKDAKFAIATADTNIVHTTKTVDSIVDEYKVGAATNALDVSAKIDPLEIKEETKELTINIDFPNAVTDNAKEYQDMKVSIVSANSNEEVALGGNMTQDGKYVVTKELVKNRTYAVTVSGAGYRTARYAVTMTEDKTLNFWNNAKDSAVNVEEGNNASAKNVTFLAGELVKDGQINIYDLSAVVSYFGTVNNVTGESQYAKYDLNRDGKVDSKDVAYVLVSWGK